MKMNVNEGVCIMTRLRGASWLASLVIVDAVALVLLFPHWAELARDVAAPHSWLERVGADRVAIRLGTAALWLVALWLAIGLAALAVTTAPGRVASQLARQLLPAVVIRAVAGAAGIGVLIAPVAADAEAASNVPGTTRAAATAQMLPSWPTDAESLSAIRISW